MIEGDLRGFLLAVPELVRLVGDDTGAGPPARICPLKLPQGTPRGLVYTLISKARDRTTNGRSGFCTARFQLDFMAIEDDDVAGYSEGKTAMDAVRNVLDSYSGPMGDSVVQDTRIENDRDEWDETTRSYLVGFDVLLDFDEG